MTVEREEEAWSVGVESLDVHHRQVWRRIRHLSNAASEGRADEVRAALRFLHGYLAEHNAEEERWMADAGYPAAREHARAHTEIVARIQAAREGRLPLRFLHGYLAEHNAEEERWMADAGYPAAREHARAHTEIVARIQAAREGEGRLPLPALLQSAEWVARSLEAHMRQDDLKVARFWTARENLRRLAESGQGVSLTPIPGTLGVVSPAAPGTATPAGPAGAEIGAGRPKGR